MSTSISEGLPTASRSRKSGVYDCAVAIASLSPEPSTDLPRGSFLPQSLSQRSQRGRMPEAKSGDSWAEQRVNWQADARSEGKKSATPRTTITARTSPRPTSCPRVRVRIMAFRVADPPHSGVWSRQGHSPSSWNRTGSRNRPRDESGDRSGAAPAIHLGMGPGVDPWAC